MALLVASTMLSGVPMGIASEETQTSVVVVVEEAGQSLEQSLVLLSVEQAELIGEFASDDKYLEWFGTSTSYDEAIAKIANAHLGQPDKAAIVRVPKNTVSKFVEMMGGKLSLSPLAEGVLNSKVMGSLPMQFIATHGVEAVVVSSMLTVGGATVLSQSFDDAIYVVLMYDNQRVVTYFSAVNAPVVTYNSWPFPYAENDSLSGDLKDKDLEKAILESLNLSEFASESTVDVLSGSTLASLLETR